MNFRIFGDNWSKYYKRGFLVAFFVLTFMCVVDQTLNTPIFFSKVNNSECYTPARYGCYVCQGRGFLKSGYDTCEKCWGDGLCKIEDP